MSEACCPWAKEQIVVMLSRTRIASDTIIVGKTKFAVDKIWNLITIGTQWTAYIDQLLDRISVNGNGGPICDVDTVISFPSVYPYRISDISLPSDSTGFVYMLARLRITRNNSVITLIMSFLKVDLRLREFYHDVIEFP